MKEFFDRLYTGTNKSYTIKLSKYLDNKEKKFVLTANPEMFSLALKNQNIKDAILDTNNDVLADGIAIKKTARLYKVKVEERIAGIDVANSLIDLGNKKKKTIYLFGAKKEVVDKLKKDIEKNYKSLKVVGATNGYIENKEEEVKKIIKAEPDICLVALGMPMQEEIILKIIPHVKKGIYVGVGGSFDVLSGYKKRAPKFYINHNLEWLYRISTEPKRAPRFIKHNCLFCIKSIFDSKK